MAKCLDEMLKEELQNKVAADWIPFTEAEVDAKECFASHFMSDFLAGKGGGFIETALPGMGTDTAKRVPLNPCNPCNPWTQLSPTARAVLDAGRELWRYYHAQPGANPNASYYDIRRHVKCKIENLERKM